MDCKSARLLLEFARPSCAELHDAEMQALNHHLQACEDCGHIADSERRFDRALKPVMLDVPVPDGLQMRILGNLQRRQDARYRRVVLYRVLPAAAALLLILFGGWYWFGNQRSVVDVVSVHQDVNQRHQSTREQVDRWLSMISNNELTAPANFQYELLDHYGISTLGGRQVPMLLFARPGVESVYTARVYILRNDQFDIQKPKQMQILKTGVLKVEVLEHPTKPITYLIIYSGSSLEPFLIQAKPL